jgi:hypothetical protein
MFLRLSMYRTMQNTARTMKLMYLGITLASLNPALSISAP